MEQSFCNECVESWNDDGEPLAFCVQFSVESGRRFGRPTDYVQHDFPRKLNREKSGGSISVNRVSHHSEIEFLRDLENYIGIGSSN